MKLFFCLIMGICSLAFTSAQIDSDELRCLVCEATMQEFEKVVSTLNPDIHVGTGGYRLDADGNIKVNKVSQKQSEVHLSELLEKICDKMEDYIRATWKSNGTLTLLKILDDNGQMNNDMGYVDIIQDSDLNKSLKFYCEGIIEEHEDAIIESYKNLEDDVNLKICPKVSTYCASEMANDNNVNVNEEL